MFVFISDQLQLVLLELHVRGSGYSALALWILCASVGNGESFGGGIAGS
jgi:hypothetical protein